MLLRCTLWGPLGPHFASLEPHWPSAGPSAAVFSDLHALNI